MADGELQDDGRPVATDDAGDRPTPWSRARGAVRSVPKVMWWVTALHLTLLLAYSVLLPTYRSPDEPLHVDLAHLFSEEGRYPDWDGRRTSPGVQRSLGFVEFQSKSRNVTAEAAPPKGERPAFEDLEEPYRPTQFNQIAQHPPLYYVLSGGAERVAETVTGNDTPDFQLETWFYRLSSVLFLAPVPLIIWRTTKLLGLPTAVGVTAALLPLGIPQYVHIGSSANSDTLAFALFFLATPLVVRIANGHVGPRTAALAGLVIGLGLVTKAYAFFAAVWVLSALAVALWRLGRTALRRVLRAGAVFAGVSLAVGGWWWVRNVILFGNPKPSVYRRIVPAPENAQTDVALWVRRWAQSTTRQFWGDFGWSDIALPTMFIVVPTGVVLLGLFMCIRRDRIASPTAPIGTRLLIASPLLLLIVGHFSWTLRGHIQTGRFAAFQGRYWFGAVAAISVAVAWGLGNLMRSRIHLLPLLALVGITTMHVAAFFTITAFYWGSPDSSITERLRALVAWAPVQGEILVVGAVLGAIVVIGAVVTIGAGAFRRPSDDRASPKPPSPPLREIDTVTVPA